MLFLTATELQELTGISKSRRCSAAGCSRTATSLTCAQTAGPLFVVDQVSARQLKGLGQTSGKTETPDFDALSN